MASYQSRGGEDAVLRVDQLKRIASHRYSATGCSFLEPYMQVFWQWLVKQIPLWWAPNAITLAGLVVNGLTTFILMTYSPDAETECPPWTYVLCAFGLFFYQSMDAIDGKQARRTHSSSPLGELFDHGCDALSMVFVAIGVSVTVRIGDTPELIFFEFFIAVFAYYAAHWQTYCSGTMQFGWFDVTEGQLSSMLVFLWTAAVGPSFWNLPIGSTGFMMKAVPSVVVAVATAYSCFTYFQVVFTGGVGKNGSTVAGTSVLSPAVPIGILLSMALIGWKYSSTGIFQRHPVLYLMSFGLAISKLSSRLVIAHLSRSEMCSLDSTFFGPLILIANQYWGVIVDEYIVLWFVFIYCAFDLLRYATAVCRALCDHLGICCFHIDVPQSGPVPSAAPSSNQTLSSSRQQHCVHSVGKNGAGRSTNGIRH